MATLDREIFDGVLVVLYNSRQRQKLPRLENLMSWFLSFYCTQSHFTDLKTAFIREDSFCDHSAGNDLKGLGYHGLYEHRRVAATAGGWLGSRWVKSRSLHFPRPRMYWKLTLLGCDWQTWFAPLAKKVFSFLWERLNWPSGCLNISVRKQEEYPPLLCRHTCFNTLWLLIFVACSGHTLQKINLKVFFLCI